MTHVLYTNTNYTLCDKPPAIYNIRSYIAILTDCSSTLMSIIVCLTGTTINLDHWNNCANNCIGVDFIDKDLECVQYIQFYVSQY